MSTENTVKTPETEDKSEYGRWIKREREEKWVKLFQDRGAAITRHKGKYVYSMWGRGENIPFGSGEHQVRYSSTKSWGSLATAKSHADYALRCRDFSPYSQGNKIIASRTTKN
jgi:hypothetical protein